MKKVHRLMIKPDPSHQLAVKYRDLIRDNFEEIFGIKPTLTKRILYDTMNHQRGSFL